MIYEYPEKAVEDGTLDSFTQTYITDVIHGNDPETTTIEPIDRTNTIKAAVTGSSVLTRLYLDK